MENYWKDRNGNNIPLADMDTRYLGNIIKYLERIKQTSRPIYKALKIELQGRDIVAPKRSPEYYYEWLDGDRAIIIKGL